MQRIILVLCFAAGCSAQPPLSVSTTMDVAFVRLHEGVPWGLYGHANPEARETLRKVVDNKNLLEYQPAVWRMLGFVGDEADVKRVEMLFEKELAGVLKHDEKEVARAALDALGLLWGRRVPGAEGLVSRMLEPQYWRQVAFQPSVKAGPIPPEWEMFGWAVHGTALGGDNTFQANNEKRVAEIKDPYTRTYMQWLVSEEKVNVTRSSVKRSNKVDEEARQLAVGKFNGDLLNPGPSGMSTGGSKP